ncbi:uncharacterized protein PV09_06418 [Verruconis gallopava]|uniref:Uncharacterized protein n=1 Tax=Verruconis gallopava TaxID=253628 RepID=A0A0D2A692_9PEZI|nr:uncharacterized protein PV09_06418 [Verruconis gallopava]KIW02268.1 hypothetical protein PV09_06418 [Verruconis gallopava]
MKFSAFLILASLLGGSGVVVAQTTTPLATDLAGLVGQLNSLTAALGLTGSLPLPTGSVVNPFTQLGLPSAPSGVLQELLTGVPASVYADLANPTSRSSLQSEFKAGHTPAWYSSLPPDAKSYIQAVQTQLATMSINTGALSSISLALNTAKITGTGASATQTGTATGSESSHTVKGSGSTISVSLTAALVGMALFTIILL